MTAINRFALAFRSAAAGARPMSMNCYALRLAATELAAIKRNPASALHMAQTAAVASFGAAGELALALPQLLPSRPRAGDAKRRAAPSHDAADPFADAVSTISAASDADRGRILDLHKSWHVLHYLFTGAAEGGTPPADALLAGRACGEDMGYGAPRLHEPAAIAAFARFLAPLTVAELQQRIDIARMRDLGIYCGADAAAELGDDVEHYFPLLQEFVTAAAKTGNGMLVWLS